MALTVIVRRRVHDETGALVTDALVRAGFADAEIRKIMGENVLRVLMASLPERAQK